MILAIQHASKLLILYTRSLLSRSFTLKRVSFFDICLPAKPASQPSNQPKGKTKGET